MAEYQNISSSLSIGTDPDAGVLPWEVADYAPLDRVSNVASGAPTAFSDNFFSPIPPSPINNMSSYSQLYGGNPLPSQSYDSSYSSFQQTENVRYTPSSLEWGPQGVDFVKLYKFIVPKGKLPYLELLDKWTPTYQTPVRVYLDEPKQKGQFPCQYPGTCNSKQTVFSRPADLERHYKNVHATEKDSFPCDYPKCPRSQDPFHRKDYYRDHLRDLHKEDIGSAKTRRSSKDKRTWQQAQKIWLSERNISLKYWRCAKCLVRNPVKQGWDCSSCKTPCEEERVRIRQARGATMVDATRYAAPYCGTCSDTGYVDKSGAYELCPVCQPTTFDSGNIAGLPEMYSFEEPVDEDG
ncbi:hypothetical protein V8E51_014083, partial [Hyaloscypha variabilis]